MIKIIFKMTKKKFFIIILVLFLLTSGALVVYNFFLKNGNAPAENETGFPENELNLKITAISHEKVLAPAIGEDNKTIKYYLEDSGRVSSLAFDGSNEESISGNSLPGLSEVIWSPDRKKVIGIFSTITPKKYFYDYRTKKSILLNESIKSIAWAPSSEKIAYQYETSDGLYNNIGVADPDGTSWRAVFQTRLTDLVVAWPAADKICFFNKPSSQTAGSLFAIDPDSGAFTKILSDLYGLDIKWSPDGQKMVYQTTDQNGKNLKLYVAYSDGSQQKEMPVQTLAEKCAWSFDNQSIYCAVPQQFSQYAIWPDDYNFNRVSLIDDFYIINTASLAKTKIAGSDTAQSFDAQNLILAPGNDYLLFINRKNRLLYNIELDF
ncbi:MAG: hypothetical protein A2Y98_01390 [Candidatus Portnoybacteria bacterium RBG_19FT_COMBO_36_7]|uniref:Dipeptidylpeptidase IV N-terminal domain-containing protein n=1 Tax=Candidatus Portnoybacteria bacterium RBG_19FT_COMBO_36_7 TaxID=1801992 RepID=A0A1G2F7N0_9BACT|nr:MAG: hypothetical protein A2Y98_01390 [Candidatus Portnoybacteria bacterium RBG_19FT_COMBO_36_7]